MHVFAYIFALLFCISHNLDKIIFTGLSMYKFKTNVLATHEFSHTDFTYKFVDVNRTFSFRLLREDPIFTSEIKVFLHRGKIIKNMNLRNAITSAFYEGVQQSAIGFVRDKLLTGMIFKKDEIFYMEPAINHYPEHNNSNLSLVFSMKDVEVHDRYEDGKPICERVETSASLKTNVYRKNNILYSRFWDSNISMNINKRKNKEKMCSLELLIDHTYYQHMEGNIDKAITGVLFYVKIVDEIFKRADIDSDGYADNIGFDVEKITIFETINDIVYPIKETINDHNKCLEKLSFYDHSYCLMTCFCHRDFWNERECAISKVKEIGAICQKNLKINNTNQEINNRVGFVTNVERNMTIPRFRIISNLLHELDHAFGCMDDPIDNKYCSPGNFHTLEGNFIMNSKLSYGKFLNNWKFYSCCIKSMKKLIQIPEIDKCLMKSRLSTCGNGIEEERESCECNTRMKNCDQVKKCCLFKKSSPIQCTIKPTKACSPSPGQCCDENCTIIASSKHQGCFSNLVCFNRTAFCDGTSPFCPGEMESDGSSCLQNSGTCLKGKCQYDMCSVYNLSFCECKTRDTECHRCCKNEKGHCVTAKELHLFHSETEFFVKRPGTPCDVNHGICDQNGTCVQKSIFKM